MIREEEELFIYYKDNNINNRILIKKNSNINNIIDIDIISDQDIYELMVQNEQYIVPLYDLNLVWLFLDVLCKKDIFHRLKKYENINIWSQNELSEVSFGLGYFSKHHFN